MRINLIVLLFLLSNSLLAQRTSKARFHQELSRWYFAMNTGITHNLKNNNAFSKDMVSPFASNWEFSFGRFLDTANKQAVGFNLGGYVYYPEQSKEVLVSFLNAHGEQSFGDIIFNDWSEWRFGLYYSRFFPIKGRWFGSATVRPDIVLASRSKRVYYTDNDRFIYAFVPSTKIGWAVAGDMGIHFRLRKNFTSSIGISYDLIYGMYPASYDVRYGVGADPNINYTYYTYNKSFEILRQRIKLTLIITLSDEIIDKKRRGQE